MKKFLLMALLAISAMSCSTEDSILGITNDKDQITTASKVVDINQTDISVGDVDKKTFIKVGFFNEGFGTRIATKRHKSSYNYITDGLYVSDGTRIYYSAYSSDSYSFSAQWIEQRLSFSKNILAMEYCVDNSSLYVITDDKKLRVMNNKGVWSEVGLFNNTYGSPKDMYINGDKLYVTSTNEKTYVTSISNFSFTQASCPNLYLDVAASTYNDSFCGTKKNNFISYKNGEISTIYTVFYWYNGDDYSLLIPKAISIGGVGRGVIHYVLAEDQKTILRGLNIFL